DAEPYPGAERHSLAASEPARGFLPRKAAADTLAPNTQQWNAALDPIGQHSSPNAAPRWRLCRRCSRVEQPDHLRAVRDWLRRLQHPPVPHLLIAIARPATLLFSQSHISDP